MTGNLRGKLVKRQSARGKLRLHLCIYLLRAGTIEFDA